MEVWNVWWPGCPRQGLDEGGWPNESEHASLLNASILQTLLNASISQWKWASLLNASIPQQFPLLLPLVWLLVFSKLERLSSFNTDPNQWKWEMIGHYDHTFIPKVLALILHFALLSWHYEWAVGCVPGSLYLLQPHFLVTNAHHSPFTIYYLP